MFDFTKPQHCFYTHNCNNTNVVPLEIPNDALKVGAWKCDSMSRDIGDGKTFGDKYMARNMCKEVTCPHS